MNNGETEGTGTTTKGRALRLTIVVAVVLLFVGIILAKTALPQQPGAAPAADGSPGATASSGEGTSIASVRNDAAADYAAAAKSGKPVYVLFHSLTCQPCVEISTIADKVVPAYRDKVVFVNAITDDPSAQQLAAKFSFQYIPTSFFLKPDGTVIDSYTGVLSEADMKARLDKLVAQ